jgi:hypothetical protein
MSRKCLIRGPSSAPPRGFVAVGGHLFPMLFILAINVMNSMVSHAISEQVLHLLGE